jgi:hypothetical protein
MWHYRVDQQEYEEHPASSARADEIRQTGRYWFFYCLDRFVLLPKLASSVTFLRWEEVRRGSGRHRCAVIRMQPTASDQNWWWERLWIEPETAIIWKLVTEQRAGKRDGTFYRAGTNTTEWDSIVLGEPPDPDLFVFHPPKGARRVKKFSVHIGH